MYENSKKYMDSRAMDKYRSIDSSSTKKYGEYVLAIEISNSDYYERYAKLKDSRTMKERGMQRRIYPGYLVVRKLNQKGEYETWMPDEAFEETYEKV